ncbi:DUF4912 domain-containing protein [Candidatus Contubernalis alkaliaceticus]|uniref:DUF4912 domain-containing protein n=1 Tax=Candidatus Contubernalis alkaliaceticus TaxID=338645 RepID=UPI001F4C1A0D|nr:DUF4912 domain-containing protein [Candidatus Contubernalis alkalaceticus]UNC93426.1 DUF4912 domain-containing protein [Candidatus Contubernalis alkalaceticus]
MKNRSVTSFHLPLEYGENVIEVLVQSPDCIYAYWELSREYKDMATRHFKTAWSHLSLSLRLYQVTCMPFDGRNECRYTEYTIESHCSSFYFSQTKAGKAYVVDLGVTNQGKFLSLLRSKTIMTPLDRVNLPQGDIGDIHTEKVLIQAQKNIVNLPSSGGQ